MSQVTATMQKGCTKTGAIQKYTMPLDTCDEKEGQYQVCDNICGKNLLIRRVYQRNIVNPTNPNGNKLSDCTGPLISEKPYEAGKCAKVEWEEGGQVTPNTDAMVTFECKVHENKYVFEFDQPGAPALDAATKKELDEKVRDAISQATNVNPNSILLPESDCASGNMGGAL